jgi:hypothetical protein
MITILQTNDLIAQTWTIYVLSVIIGWAIFYYTIKAAVKNGMIEAQTHPDVINKETGKPVKSCSTEQIKLQERYERGDQKE